MLDYTSLSRTQWLELAGRFYARFFQVCESLTPSQWEARTQYLGWSGRGLLAHMASAIPVNFRGQLQRALAGDPSAPSEFNTFARNAREVRRRRNVPIPDVLAEWRSQVGDILATFRSMTEADWLKPAWFYVGPVNVRALFLALFGDQVFHERDLLLLKGGWRHFDPEIVRPLLDWYLRELRPANFRSDRAQGLAARINYHLGGPSAGDWSMTIEKGSCTVQQGLSQNPDVTIEADTEDLLAASQARAPSWVGALARLMDWIRGPSRAEDVVALITGVASLAAAARLSRRIRVRGDAGMADRVNNSFWHFWQRSEQAEYNIARGRA